MLRWWWFGPSVERDELYRELTAMAQAGFGGVEVAYVYPLGESDYRVHVRRLSRRPAVCG